jgi:hypothetical protein
MAQMVVDRLARTLHFPKTSITIHRTDGSIETDWTTDCLWFDSPDRICVICRKKTTETTKAIPWELAVSWNPVFHLNFS